MDIDEDTVIDTWRQFEESSSLVLDKIERFILEDYLISKTSTAISEKNEDNGFLHLLDGIKANADSMRSYNKKDSEYLEEVEHDSQKIAKSCEKIKKNIESLENAIHKMETKITSIQEKEQDLQKLKDVILTYKLLTSANIVYSSNIVEGYISGKENEPFQLDPKKKSADDIAKAVWDIIKLAHVSKK